MDFATISQKFKNYDVLIIGEEHDDRKGHEIKLQLIQFLTRDHKFSLSLEMLEWHQQDTLEEYLTGLIPLQQMMSHTVLWNNFKRDYLPIIDHAKDNKIRVIASNPPRKYVNLVSRNGMLAYRKLPPQSQKYLPLPQSVLRDRSGQYEAKLRELFGSFHKEPQSADLAAMDRMILAQHIWDAGMTEKIACYHYQTGGKIIHINGRFHSDYGLGVTYRLKKAGLRTLTISIVPEERLKSKEKSDLDGIADFLILTN